MFLLAALAISVVFAADLDLAIRFNDSEPTRLIVKDILQVDPPQLVVLDDEGDRHLVDLTIEKNGDGNDTNPVRLVGRAAPFAVDSSVPGMRRSHQETAACSSWRSFSCEAGAIAKKSRQEVPPRSPAKKSRHPARVGGSTVSSGELSEAPRPIFCSPRPERSPGATHIDPHGGTRHPQHRL